MPEENSRNLSRSGGRIAELLALVARIVAPSALGCALMHVSAPAWAEEAIAVVADPGRFGTIEQAAAAEREVDWWDADQADDTACTVSFAAMELRRILARSLGRPESDIALRTPSQIPADGQLFVVAGNDAPWLGVAVPDAISASLTPPKPGGFRVRDFSHDGRRVTIIRGRDRVGALYGVYAWAEKLGVRFHGLGEAGTAWPAVPPVLPVGLDFTEAPEYATRGFWAFENRGNPDFFLWMARNRLNFWTVAEGQDHHFLKKLGLRLNGGHHDIQFHSLGPHLEYPYRHALFGGGSDRPRDPYPVSAEYAGDVDADGRLSYFEAHPEWYCLKDGQRSSRISAEFGDNFCTSNLDAVHELTLRLIDQCVEGLWREADIINFWMLDGGDWCECEACRSQGTPSDRLIVVIDATLRAFEEARRAGRLQRPLQLVTLAYHETLPAPTRPLPPGFDYENCAVTFFPIERCYAHALADPACIEVNAQMLRDFTGWTEGADRHYQGTVFVGEYYNLSAFKSLPLLFPRVMAADIPSYFDRGARHFHYMHVLTRQWGTWTLNNYLMARLLWNPKADVPGLLEEYFEKRYPTATSPMRRLYDELETASANSKPFFHYMRTSAGRYGLRERLADAEADLFPLDHLRFESHHPSLNDAPDVTDVRAALDRARRAVDSALAACRDPVERVRIEEDERRFGYGEAMFELYYQLIETARWHRLGRRAEALTAFARVEEQIEKLGRIVDLVQGAGAHADAADGFAASRLGEVCEFFRRQYTAASD